MDLMVTPAQKNRFKGLVTFLGERVRASKSEYWIEITEILNPFIELSKAKDCRRVRNLYKSPTTQKEMVGRPGLVEICVARP